MIIAPGFIGIDVSKATLDIYDSSGDRWWQIANRADALAPLLEAWRAEGRFVTLEATGRYDRVLCDALAKAGLAYARVNPGRARAFARALGLLAKTDRIDARLLARMGATLGPAAAPPPSDACRQLAAIVRRRDQLVALRQQERTRRADPDADGILADSFEAVDAVLNREIAAIERHIADLIAATDPFAHKRDLIASVPGVGPVTAAVLLALMPELGTLSPRQIAALAGLAPLNRDSGTKRGKRAIAGGRKRVRDALYMAAFAAKRFCPPLAAFYQRLRDAGKPFKLAIIATARKLLTILNAILRTQSPFAQ